MISLRLLVFFFFLNCGYCLAQKEMRLYPGEIPNSKAVKNEQIRVENALVDSLTSKVSIPTLTVYRPEEGKANGTAVIICPGGGYHVLLTKREGSDVAKAFTKLGVTAFVLKYRLPNDEIMVDKANGPLQDAQQAILMVRENAKLWQINPNKIGIMGFSAGGHLASSAGTHFNKALINLPAGVSVRPDFMLLINPVISFTNEIGHLGSRGFLIGDSPSQEKIDFFSSEKQVEKTTPPAFLVHSGADAVVPVENSLAFYKAMQSRKIPVGLHIYSTGEHGFLSAPSFNEWFGRCTYWMRSMDLL